uniref:Uncharacterized protein n=1 Tax=Aegilops tauschii TaxID=37682 RepID=M8BVR9_AEGTA
MRCGFSTTRREEEPPPPIRADAAIVDHVNAAADCRRGPPRAHEIAAADLTGEGRAISPPPTSQGRRPLISPPPTSHGRRISSPRI